MTLKASIYKAVRTYPAVLQLWTSRSEVDSDQHLIDPPAQGEASFDIQISTDGRLASNDGCTFQTGSNSRILDFLFTGYPENGVSYTGEVTLTKPNGEQHTDMFYGDCFAAAGDTSVQMEWFMLVPTPNGYREHRGKLHTE